MNPKITFLQEIESLISSSKPILKKQAQKQKHERTGFNIFSILKMEKKENQTHSAILGVLLDKYGSHLEGTKFLDLFSLNSANFFCFQAVNPKTVTKIIIDKLIMLQIHISLLLCSKSLL